MLRLLSGALGVVLCACLLVALGMWQLQRLEWKETLLGQLKAGIDAPPIVWAGDPVTEFTHVRLTPGRLQSSPALYLYGRTLDGEAGAHVIALYRPLRGTPIIVDRGFVPVPIDYSISQSPALYIIDGIARAPAKKAWFDPKNSALKNEWYWMDLPAMAAALGANDVAPYYIEVLHPTGKISPIPTADRLAANIPNNHLQYAITWFSLAAALIIIYGIWLTRRLGDKYYYDPSL